MSSATHFSKESGQKRRKRFDPPAFLQRAVFSAHTTFFTHLPLKSNRFFENFFDNSVNIFIERHEKISVPLFVIFAFTVRAEQSPESFLFAKPSSMIPMSY